MEKLKEFKDPYEELTEAEQFCLKISEIERPLPRLKSLQFINFYHEIKSDMKPVSKELKNEFKTERIQNCIIISFRIY